MKVTPLYNAHLSLGAKMMTSAAGFQMPAHYKSVQEEHCAVRERVGIMDFSHMGRIDVKGEGALAFVQKLAVNDASRLSDGQAMYTTFCDERGHIVDDVTVWRFGPKHFRVVTSSVMRFKCLEWIESHVDDMAAYVTDISSSLGMISVQGPRSRDMLQNILDIDLKGLKFFRFTSAKLGGVPVLIARVGYSGELGYECYVNTEDTFQTWNAIMEAGREFDLLPFGYDAVDTLRLEKGFIFFGFEITEKNNPFECGLDRWIRFDKPEFLGKETLLKLKQYGPERKLVGLELRGEDIPSASQSVIADDTKIGEVVLSFRGLTVGKNLAWAFVDTKHAKQSSEVTVDSKGRKCPATIVDIRYYDPTGERMKT